MQRLGVPTHTARALSHGAPGLAGAGDCTRPAQAASYAPLAGHHLRSYGIKSCDLRFGGGASCAEWGEDDGVPLCSVGILRATGVGGCGGCGRGADPLAVVVSVGGIPSLLSDPYRQLRARAVSRGALAELEKATLTAERTKAGLAAAKRRGVKVGRKQELTAAQVGHARTLFASGEGARLLLERWEHPGQLSIAPSRDFRNLLEVLEVEPRAM